MTRPLLTFFTLTYAVTWICFIAGGAILRAGAPDALSAATLAWAFGAGRLHQRDARD